MILQAAERTWNIRFDLEGGTDMKENAWLSYSEEQKAELEALAGRYKKFLDTGKTERECAAEAIRLARAAGYVSLEEVQEAGKKLEPGDKVYACGMKKMLVLFQIGKQPLENGMRILGAHIDSPRLDLKQNPMYEDTEMAYLDTHYYGGVKKYQWVTIPLAIMALWQRRTAVWLKFRSVKKRTIRLYLSPTC